MQTENPFIIREKKSILFKDYKGTPLQLIEFTSQRLDIVDYRVKI